MDYLKYDYCHMQNEKQPVRYYYEKMRDALNATGRPIHFNICSWGAGEPHLWGRQVGNSWRTGRDVFAVWDERTARNELRLPALLQSIETAIEGQVGLSKYSGPGGCASPSLEPRPTNPALIDLLASRLTQRSHLAASQRPRYAGCRPRRYVGVRPGRHVPAASLWENCCVRLGGRSSLWEEQRPTAGGWRRLVCHAQVVG